MFKGKQLQVTYIANLMKELDPTAPSALNLTNGIEELSDKESELVVGGIGTSLTFGNFTNAETNYYSAPQFDRYI